MVCQCACGGYSGRGVPTARNPFLGLTRFPCGALEAGGPELASGGSGPRGSKNTSGGLEGPEPARPEEKPSAARVRFLCVTHEQKAEACAVPVSLAIGPHPEDYLRLIFSQRLTGAFSVFF
ncbi:hypothetical protein AAFF_G00141920 [Aldrovandia affinis]|uniref:Uncharacterized protein n=1 Tax=Aldrovandia affinis TaxID=143900 RepID=A0AAD7X355_9TELE|nr:hypothetical protein AAFF_G00141920 [Aldrovandia affinis]